jgi:hypothetical protein
VAKGQYGIIHHSRLQALRPGSVGRERYVGPSGHRRVGKYDSIFDGETYFGDVPFPIEQRLGRRIDFVLGANAMLASALVWVLDREQGRVYVSDRDVNVYA